MMDPVAVTIVHLARQNINESRAVVLARRAGTRVFGNSYDIRLDGGRTVKRMTEQLINVSSLAAAALGDQPLA